MSLLHYPRCPRCEGELPNARLYSKGRTWQGVVLIGDGSLWGGILTAGNTGVVCPHCAMRLLVVQSRAVWGGSDANDWESMVCSKRVISAPRGAS